METLTLSQLLAAADAALRSGYDGPADRRAGRIPNRRAFRFYAARRLIDPPAQMRGRVGLYTQLHLHQLIAIKRLQAEGKSLEEIGRKLDGIDAAALGAAAAPPVPEHRPPAGASTRTKALSEMEFDAGITLRFDPPLRASRALRRRLESASRALVRSVRVERRRQHTSAKEQS